MPAVDINKGDEIKGDEINLFLELSYLLVALDNADMSQGIPLKEPSLLREIEKVRGVITDYYKKNPDAVLRKYCVYKNDSANISIDLYSISSFIAGMSWFRDMHAVELSRASRIPWIASSQVGHKSIKYFLRLTRELLLSRTLQLQRQHELMPASSTPSVALGDCILKDIQGFEPITSNAVLEKERRIRFNRNRRRKGK